MSKTDTLKAATINIEKGGTGKTSVTLNLGEYLANKGFSVLMIDQDKSMNLTDRFINYHGGAIPQESQISTLYYGDTIQPLSIHTNIDLLAANPSLADIEDNIKAEPNNRLILLNWIIKNYEELNDKYDYILIDTHNDLGLLAQNAWVASDIILGVSDPSNDGFTAVIKLEKAIKKLKQQLIEIRSGESYLVAEYYFIGNKIKHNTNTSREFIATVEGEPNYLGFIPDKELMNISNLELTPLIELKKETKIYHDHKKFFDQIELVFDTIIDKLN